MLSYFEAKLQHPSQIYDIFHCKEHFFLFFCVKKRKSAIFATLTISNTAYEQKNVCLWTVDMHV